MIASDTTALSITALGAMAIYKMDLGAMVTCRMALGGTAWAGRLRLDVLGTITLGAMTTGDMTWVGQLR